MTTDLSDMDVIMGRGEKRLFNAIRYVVDSYRRGRLHLYTPASRRCRVTTSAPSPSRGRARRRAGDPDRCRRLLRQQESRQPDRRRRHVQSRHRHGRAAPAPPRADGLPTYDVNLIGEYNIAGEFWHVAPLFDELGLRILCTLSGDSRFHEVQTMHRARVNMVVCAKALLNVARKMQDSFGIPFFEGSFYGVQDVSNALRDFARLIADPDLTARTEAVIAREEAKAHAALEPWRARLKDKRVLLYTGGVKSWSIVSALQDLGLKVVATGTDKCTEEDKARIRELMGENTKMITDGSPKALLSTYHDHQADILIAGGRNLYTALKARIPFLDINQEREFGYEGYTGMEELARQLALSMESPVWAAVRKPAPWAKQSGPGTVLAA